MINLVDNALLGLWSYANIHGDEGYFKNKIDKGVCDLLVVFGSSVMIFSDKSIKFNEDKDISIARKRWFRGSVIDSSRQLYEAEKFIRENPHRICVDKDCKVEFSVKINRTSRFHLVAVTDNISAPAKKYLDSLSRDSSATLVSTLIYDMRERLNNIFCVGDLCPNKTFIHMLDELSLTLLLTELNTATNFIECLIAKEKAIKEQHLTVSLSEEEILASYLLEDKKIISDNILREQGLISVPEGEWVYYTRSFQYQHVIAIKEGNVFWDDFIENCSKSILAANIGFFGGQPFSMHETAVGEVAKESRPSRYYLSKLFKKKMDSVPSHMMSSMLVESLGESGRFYLLFLASQKDEIDYLTYRERQVAFISMHFPIAFARHKQIKRIIAIATEPKDSSGRSEDIIYVHSPKLMSREERTEVLKAARNINVMSDFVPWKQSATTKHYAPPRSNMRKLGRNEPCYCGSGKKYKECHG